MKRHEYAMDGYAGYAYPSIGFMDMLVNIKPLLLLLLLVVVVVVVVVVAVAVPVAVPVAVVVVVVVIVWCDPLQFSFLGFSAMSAAFPQL